MNFNRRQFIKRLVLGLASVEAFFLLRNGVGNNAPDTNAEGMVNLGKVDSFQKGNVYPFVAHKLYVKRMKDGGFLALSNQCTHLGCVVNLNPQSNGFSCPCHASHFNENGEVLSAPAPRPLDQIPIHIKNGELFVDLAHPKKRNAYEKNQLTYA